VGDGKTLHLRVGVAFIVAEEFGGIVTGSDAGAADTQSHFGGVKEFVEQLFASRGRELVEGVAGSVGKSSTESQHLLEFLAGVDDDRVRVGCARSAPG
jgi:hypothetical protein